MVGCAGEADWISRSTRCGSGLILGWAVWSCVTGVSASFGLFSRARWNAWVSVIFARLGPDKLALRWSVFLLRGGG